MNMKKEENSWKDYFQFGEVLGYFFRKKDPERKTNFSLRVMHGINRISIVIFLIAVIILIIRWVF
ncbi:MAG: hypothetical protein KFF73_16370 [Cyclobacteriaceae bacterium]|nr:hypothetical protein [Cyclobacteriaceae bacterium]